MSVTFRKMDITGNHHVKQIARLGKTSIICFLSYVESRLKKNSDKNAKWDNCWEKPVGGGRVNGEDEEG
jgi:hypothetical protein